MDILIDLYSISNNITAIMIMNDDCNYLWNEIGLDLESFMIMIDSIITNHRLMGFDCLTVQCKHLRLCSRKIKHVDGRDKAVVRVVRPLDRTNYSVQRAIPVGWVVLTSK